MRLFASRETHEAAAFATSPSATGVSDASRPAERASQTYNADQITIHQHGDMAVVAFRLVATPKAAGEAAAGENTGGAPTYYRNTGTFLKQNGKWQAVAWQSTKMPAESAATGK